MAAPWGKVPGDVLVSGPRYHYGGPRVESIKAGLRRTLQNNLAELVANGAGINEAGVQLGLTKGRTARLWAEIKTGLGAQAC